MTDLTDNEPRNFSDLSTAQKTMLADAFRDSAEESEEDLLEGIADDLFHAATYGRRQGGSEAQREDCENIAMRGFEIQAVARRVLGFELKV